MFVPGGCYFFTVNLLDRNSLLLVANVEDWPYSTFHRDHRDTPKPGDFEKKCAEYALANANARFGERS